MKKKYTRKLFLVNIVFLAICIFAFDWLVQSKAEFNPALQGEMEKLIILDEKRDVSLLSFSQKGFEPDQLRTLSDFKNNWLVVNFWATWCAPCIKELPSLEKLQEEYASKDVRVLAIALDNNMTEDKLSTFLTKHNLGGLVPQYYDAQGNISRKEKFRGYPTTWIVDPFGRLVAKYEGDADWASPDSFAFIDSVIR